jgi:hypothetical protein
MTHTNQTALDIDLDKLEALARAAERMFTGMHWYTRFQILDGISNDESAAFIGAMDPDTILALIELARRERPSAEPASAAGAGSEQPLLAEILALAETGMCYGLLADDYCSQIVAKIKASGAAPSSSASEYSDGLPNQFRKKPVVIEAIQWPGTKFETTPPKWFSDAMYLTPGAPGFVMRWDNDILIETLEGQMRAQPGDWIIRGIKGELYPCKPDIFAASYEPARAAHQAATNPVSSDALRVVVEEAASVFESAAKHNTSKGRTVFAHEQQDRANRLRAAIAATTAKGGAA